MEGTDTFPARSLLLNPPARCRDHTAMPSPAHLPLAKQHSQTPTALPLAPSPLWGWGGAAKRKHNHRREVKGEGCLTYSPHLPPAHESPPVSRICIHRAAFEQLHHWGGNFAERCRPQLQKGMEEDTSSEYLCPYPYPLWETAPMII